MSTATMTSTTTMTLADLKAQEKAAKKAEKERQKRIDADEKAERKRAPGHEIGCAGLFGAASGVRAGTFHPAR